MSDDTRPTPAAGTVTPAPGARRLPPTVRTPIIPDQPKPKVARSAPVSNYMRRRKV